MCIYICEKKQLWGHLTLLTQISTTYYIYIRAAILFLNIRSNWFGINLVGFLAFVLSFVMYISHKICNEFYIKIKRDIKMAG